jgi:hypothetical protein
MSDERPSFAAAISQEPTIGGADKVSPRLISGTQRLHKRLET